MAKISRDVSVTTTFQGRWQKIHPVNLHIGKKGRVLCGRVVDVVQKMMLVSNREGSMFGAEDECLM